MYEYGLHHKVTGERMIIFGYWLENAFKRAGLNRNDWEVTYSNYVD